PFVSQRNAIDGADGARTVAAGADERGIGQSFDLARRGIERAIHEALDRTRHVTEVLGGADQPGMRPQQVLDPRSEGRARAQLHLFFGGVSALSDGVYEPMRAPAGMTAVNDEYMVHACDVLRRSL